jgi:glycosyltransferase involved in cell wall biosynthesis
MSEKIIVITPVKNEGWILETFLKTTSLFADHIIIADQNSTDNSAAIASSFSKVTLIENKAKAFNEAERQKILINAAREKFGTNNILLALDADEIIAYNSLHSKEWDLIKTSHPGTVLYFEKPTFYDNTDMVIRYANSEGWPMGFIDDGSEHNPKFIHSARIPCHANAPKLYLKEIKFLHCNLLSLPRQRSKIRYYCMLEALAKTKPWRHRIVNYSRKYDYSKEGDGLMKSEQRWTKGWEEKGVQFNNPEDARFYWYDREVLLLFKKHGFKKFWREDVWDVDWKEAIEHFKIDGLEYEKPPLPISVYRGFSRQVFKISLKVKRRLRTI